MQYYGYKTHIWKIFSFHEQFEFVHSCLFFFQNFILMFIWLSTVMCVHKLSYGRTKLAMTIIN